MRCRCVMALILIVAVVSTTGTALGVKRFDSREITDKDKEWSIRFNSEVDKESVSNKTIYVEGKDMYGKKVYVYNEENEYKVNGKEVKIKLGAEYQYDTLYTLRIKNVRGVGLGKVEESSLEFKLIKESIEGKREEVEREQEDRLNILTEEIIEEIGIEEKENGYGKAYKIYMWVKGNFEYDEEEYGSPDIYSYGRTALGALDSRKAVCEGYARAFKALMDTQEGIETRYVCGYSGAYHAWNEVKIEGKWYNVDCTKNEILLSDEAFEELGYRIDAEYEGEGCKDTKFDWISFEDMLSIMGIDEDSVRDWWINPSKLVKNRYESK